MQKKFGSSKSFKIIADGQSFGQKKGTALRKTAFTIEILIPRVEAALSVHLNIRNDKDNDFVTIPMPWTDMTDGYDVFSAEIDTRAIGLYWFYITVDKHGWQEYTHKNGPFVYLNGDENNIGYFQLTIYERAYNAPEFIYGGVFYHIFIDRFNRGSKNKNLEYSRSALNRDNIKSRYHVKNEDEYYDNHIKRSVVLQNNWGNEPIWQFTDHGEILNNDFFGGTLNGIIEKLDYLSDLGATCLYLSPIFEAYSSHKYDTGDYGKIDAMFGDDKDFAKLCQEAKKRGIAIMLDGVFNHTGADSRYFNAYGIYDSIGAYQSQSSKYTDWYHFDKWPDAYNSWWGIDTLPTVEKNVQSHKDYLFNKDGIIRKYIRLGASGWRLDVVDELPADFLKELTLAAKTEKKDAIVLGEVWEDASNKIAYSYRREYFWGQELDSVMNYPWKNAIISFIRNGDSFGLSAAVDQILCNYPPEVVDALMNPLGTHDSMRILTALAADNISLSSRDEKAYSHLSTAELANGICLLKLASLLQMMLPGVPCIYYADETAMEGYDDPFNRRCYPWGHENKDLQNWYRQLTNLRHDYRNVFYNTDFEILEYRDSVFGFRRWNLDLEIICYVNRSGQEYITQPAEGFTQIVIDQITDSDGPYVYAAQISNDDEQLYVIPPKYGYLLLLKHKK